MLLILVSLCTEMNKGITRPMCKCIHLNTHHYLMTFLACLIIDLDIYMQRKVCLVMSFAVSL